MVMPPSTVQLPIVVALAAELPQLAHGESTPRVQSAARAMGISVQTCWRWVRDAGFASGRKRRADAGSLRAVTADQVRQMAAIKLAGARETGKVLPTLEMVKRIANANAVPNAETGEVRHTTAHISTISRAMRNLGCHTDQLMRQSPAMSLRSLHPNHVWQGDVSTCVLFWLSNGGIEICDVAAFNKNKPSSYERVKEMRVQRYLVVDHCTGAYYLHYLPGHETAANLLDFLIPAFHQRGGRPFFGVPKILMVDPGSAQASGVFRSIARALDMQVIVHEAGNPRAKGGVEGWHNHVEHEFEGRLHAQKVRDFAHLNELADIWSAAHQSTAVHSRHGQTRYAAWMRIKPSELRIAPGLEITRALVMSEPVSRVVSGTMTITYAVPGHGQRTYSVAGVPGAAPKEKLWVVASPYTLPDVDVLVTGADGHETRHRLSPIAVDDWGFNEQGAVIGQEFKRHADTWIDTERKAASRAAWGSDDKREIAKIRKGRGGERGVAFGGAVDTFADVRQVPVPTYLPVQGTAIDIDTPSTAESLMSATTACLRMQALLGDDWQPDHYRWLTTKFVGGIGEQQFQQLAATWQAAIAGLGESAATGTHGQERPTC